MVNDLQNADANHVSKVASADLSEQVWNALFETASELAEYADAPPLVLTSFERVRQKAALLAQELSSHRHPLPTMPIPHSASEEHGKNDTVSAEFNGVAQSLTDRLLELVADAVTIAATNNSATGDYWQRADVPQSDLEGTLESLCVSLEPLGIKVPGTEERRIREEAWKMVRNLDELRRRGMA